MAVATIPFLFFPSVFHHFIINCLHVHHNFFYFLCPTEIIRAERINIHDISTNSATVHWRPVLSGLRGYYEVRFGPLVTQVPGSGGGAETGTSPSTGGSQYQRLVQPADSSTARLIGLKPDTTYSVTLIPESNEHSFNALTATFTTKPGEITFFTHCTISLIHHFICAVGVYLFYMLTSKWYPLKYTLVLNVIVMFPWPVAH